jgi:hypothetical protein
MLFPNIICSAVIISYIHDDHRKLTFTTSFILPVLQKELHIACMSVYYVVWSHDTSTLYIASLSGLNSKEVIRPQVPLRPPCYDFSLVADPRFDSAN